MSHFVTYHINNQWTYSNACSSSSILHRMRHIYWAVSLCTALSTNKIEKWVSTYFVGKTGSQLVSAERELSLIMSDWKQLRYQENPCQGLALSGPESTIKNKVSRWQIYIWERGVHLPIHGIEDICVCFHRGEGGCKIWIWNFYNRRQRRRQEVLKRIISARNFTLLNINKKKVLAWFMNTRFCIAKYGFKKSYTW